MANKPFSTQKHALAYLMGVYLSDGFIAGTASFTLQVKDKEFRDETARALRGAGSTYSWKTTQPRRRDGKGFKSEKHGFVVHELSPYKVGRWLWKEFQGVRSHLPTIPDDLVRDLVAGIMDGDGGAYHKKCGTFSVKVFGDSEYLWDLQGLFADHFVKMYYKPEKSGQRINLKSFLRAGFYFRMPRKQAILEQAARHHMISYDPLPVRQEDPFLDFFGD